MTRAELEEMIEAGENSYVEFKEDRILPHHLAEEIVAFANTEGGRILLGVDDHGQRVGLTRHDLEEWCLNICRTGVIPGVIPGFEIVKFPDHKDIAVLTIPKGVVAPYQSSTGHYYVRVGSQKREATREELSRLFQSSGMVTYDETPVLGTSIADIDRYAVADYFQRFHDFDPFAEPESTERILINASILIREETTKSIVATVGGLLLFGLRPEVNLPQSGLTVARIRGITLADELVDRTVINGRLPDVVDKTVERIRVGVPTPVYFAGTRRIDHQPYPAKVLREAVVNAVVHRNYSIAGSQIRVLVFDDRVEFHSPGRLPNTVTIEKMKIGVSFARNPQLLRYMQNLGYIERLGRGIPMILKEMRMAGAREPRLEVSGEEFILTLYPAPNPKTNPNAATPHTATHS
ncbi:MAG: histidine kinase [Firmicutes bacterium]|nr:histidine kinase [Bacillota bacterium]